MPGLLVFVLTELLAEQAEQLSGLAVSFKVQ